MCRKSDDKIQLSHERRCYLRMMNTKESNELLALRLQAHAMLNSLDDRKVKALLGLVNELSKSQALLSAQQIDS